MKTTTKNKQAELLQNPEKFTDTYFTDSKNALQQEEINPKIRKKVFARIDEEQGQIAGLERAAQTTNQITNDEVDIYINENNTFESKEPLMVLEGPIQQLLEPETINLGIISHHLTEANPGYEHPEPEEYGEALGEIADIFGEVDVPFADFGARHYHPLQQAELGRAAIDNGAVNHSTIAGAETHGKEPTGTMPHAFVLPFAYEHGMENATLEAAKAMDNYTDKTTPVLIDTANKEATDLLKVCGYMEEEYGEDFELVARMDTCGENYAETSRNISSVDDYLTGKGMTVEAVMGLAEDLHENGYRDNVTLAISSGMGNPEKARQFAKEHSIFEANEGYSMFDVVGAGSFNDSDNIHATSDIYEIEGEPVAKVGREQDIEEINQYIDQNMVEVTQ